MFKKAQAAMEFLMSYGWAIMIVIVVIGALVYFMGPKAIQNIIPDRCISGDSGLACKAALITNNGFLKIKLANNYHEPVTISSITSFDSSTSCTTGIISKNIGPGGSDDVALSCTGISLTDKKKLMMTTSFYKASEGSGFSHPVKGDIVLSAASATGTTQGLLGYWRFNTAGQAEDNSGNNNGGTIYGGATWQASCKQGGCYSFDGVNGYISIPSVNPTQAITVTAWVKSNLLDYSGFWQIVSKYNAYILGTTGYGNRMAFIINNGGWADYNNYYDVGSPNSWHHFAGTFDSITHEEKLYVDGVLRNTKTVSGTIASDTGPIHIAHRECCAEYFNGMIDEVRIYDAVLGPDEILAIYNLET